MSLPVETVQYGRRGHPADILHWPSQADTPSRTVVVFIPGNPGLVHYYRSFLSKIHRDLSPQLTTVYAVGHLGHSPAHEVRRWTSRGAASLDEQVQHKIDFVDKLRENLDIGLRETDTKLVLVGHSIGSWISSQVLKARPEAVHSIVQLFPTISHMRLTENGQRLAPLFTKAVLPPVALGTTLLSLIPQSMLTRVVTILAGQSESPDSAKATTALVSSPGTVISALSMAADEMAQVTDLDHDLLRTYGDRMYWYWAEGDSDHWVRDSSVKEIEQVLDEAGHPKKGRRWRCSQGMKHAFVLRDDHADKLAGYVSDWINRTGT
ncbi:hypothetical protein OIV83_000009 [Microbotryomycetes sp. JL201]|nr:hypothetical protein OIV83_000009 [Microbotryomycetes sp. JL201]